MEAVRNFFKDWRGKAWFLLNMFCTVVYLFWRLFFTIPFEYGTVSIIAGVALLVVEVLGMVEAFIHYANMYNVTHYELPQVPEALYPDVDVFIATYNEPVELLYKTVLGCKRMTYPDKCRVHIYLCDDGKREAMRELAAKMGVNYLSREDNKGAKAGNLNNALAHSSSELVVTFDADMIPKHDFLLKTVPYFVDAQLKNQGKAEEDQIPLGFVQTPQSFYDLDLFQFNFYSEARIPNEQELLPGHSGCPDEDEQRHLRRLQHGHQPQGAGERWRLLYRQRYGGFCHRHPYGEEGLRQPGAGRAAGLWNVRQQSAGSDPAAGALGARRDSDRPENAHLHLQ